MVCFVLWNSLIVLLDEPNPWEVITSLAFDAVGYVLGQAFASSRVPALDLCYSPVIKQIYGTKKPSSEQGRRGEKHSTKENQIALCSKKLIATWSKEQMPIPNIARNTFPSLKGFLAFFRLGQLSETCFCKILCKEILPCSAVPTTSFHLFLYKAALTRGLCYHFFA